MKVLPKSIKKASIFNITTVLNTNLLKVRGRFLNESNLQVKWGGKICTQTSVEFNEILCTKSTDVETGSKYYLGPLAWLREKYVFFRDSDMKNALDGEAWSTAIEGFKSYLRPSPGDIMDKLRSGSIKSGYATVCIRSLLPGSHAGTPWEYNSDNPSIDLKKTYGKRSAIFQRVSGVYEARHNGYIRMVSRHNAGDLLTIRMCKTLNADLCYENSDKMLLSKTLRYSAVDVRSSWVRVEKGTSYLVEILTKYNPRHNRRWGDLTYILIFPTGATMVMEKQLCLVKVIPAHTNRGAQEMQSTCYGLPVSLQIRLL